MFINDTTVKVERVIVTWDAITKPDKNDDGSYTHELGFAIAQNAPEYNELKTIAQNAVNNDPKFRGTLPAGAHEALKPVDVSKMGSIVQGHDGGKASTKRGMPPVFDENGRQLTVDELQGVFYAGCVVSILVHAFTYDNKQKGVKFGIDGIVIKDRNAPKLDVATGMSQAAVASAFGFESVTQQAPAPAPQQQAPAPAPQQQAPVPAPQQQAPAPAPANDLASGKIMTPAAEYTYQQYIDAGWTDEQLIANGLMVG